MSDEWEVVTREELRDGDEVRVTGHGRWAFGSLHYERAPHYERKVVKPSPEAVRAAEAVLEYVCGHAVLEPEHIEQAARRVDTAMRGES